MTFKCVQCPEMFLLERQWVDHLESEHGLVPVLLNPTVSDSSQMTKSDPSLSNPSTRPVDNIAPAPRQGVEPKVRFHVAYDLGRGDEVSPIRTTIPKDESYENFLRRLRYVFDGESFEISLRQWEYVLVNRQYERGDPLLLTSSNTYYAMVSELLRPRSTWRYAIIRRSRSEHPIIRAVAEGTFHLMQDPSVLDIPAPDTSLPGYPPTLDASQPDSSSINIPPVDDSISTDPSEAWVMSTPSVESLSRAPSPEAQELSTPSTAAASAQDRRLVHLSSPKAFVSSTSSPSRLNPPPTPVDCTQSLNISDPLPSAPAVSTESRKIENLLSSAPSADWQDPSMILTSTTPPAAGFDNPPIEESSTSDMAASVLSAYVQAQSDPTTLPTASEQPLAATISSTEATQIKPTPIFRPRRPLWIVSRRQVNNRVEYQVHWNGGRDSWESHDSLYRDYPAFIHKFSGGEC